MDNLDIFIYTGIVFFAFISFGIITFKELKEIGENAEHSAEKNENQKK